MRVNHLNQVIFHLLSLTKDKYIFSTIVEIIYYFCQKFNMCHLYRLGQQLFEKLYVHFVGVFLIRANENDCQNMSWEILMDRIVLHKNLGFCSNNLFAIHFYESRNLASSREYNFSRFNCLCKQNLKELSILSCL